MNTKKDYFGAGAVGFLLIVLLVTFGLLYITNPFLIVAVISIIAFVFLFIYAIGYAIVNIGQYINRKKGEEQ
jgi:hypothetical protein